MAIFFNQATLSYGGNTVNSNTTEAELLSGLEITKTAVTPSYSAGGNAVYVITVSNMGGTAYNALTVNDDLGAYALPGGGTAVPLSYSDGSILYYLDGVLQPAPTVTAANGLAISGINLPGGSTATFIYEAEVNEFAPVAAGSTITNTASTNGGTGVGIISASATVTVDEAPQLTIAKAVCPPVLSDNDRLTYTIIIQNLGNTPIIATDGVIIRDVFNPVLSDITVTLDGTELALGTGYTYNTATGEFATTNGAITVPAATYTADAATGAITTTPGVAILTITGTV
ncbi:MAG: DUF11 domain-containing protein [Ruminococcaceae bacterium]|nr:DUF11 domain-containing protein [Oscillospiraceae bacterium]